MKNKNIGNGCYGSLRGGAVQFVCQCLWRGPLKNNLNENPKRKKQL